MKLPDSIARYRCHPTFRNEPTGGNDMTLMEPAPKNFNFRDDHFNDLDIFDR